MINVIINDVKWYVLEEMIAGSPTENHKKYLLIFGSFRLYYEPHD